VVASTVSIGPWTGGLNLTSNRDLSPYLANNELGAALNVQYTREGFVESRPGFKVFPSEDINTAVGVTIKVLGSIYITDQEVGVVQVKSATNVKIYYITGAKQSYLKATIVDATLDFSSVLAIKNSEAALTTETPRGVFLFDSVNDNKCYRLEEIPSILGAATPILMSATLKVPASHFSFSIKDRVFLVNKKTSRLWWSALNVNSLWFDYADAGQKGIEAGYQDMDPSLDNTDDVQAVEFINNSFYLFKKSSTYMYTYQAKPEEDGYMRKISDSLGAFDSTLFRNTIVVVNSKGVFSVEGTEFNDLQTKLNLRFETFLDVVNPKAFITDFNGNILVGYVSGVKEYYYVLNGYTRGWAQWDFSYADVALASPGSAAVLCRTTTDEGIMLFTTFNKTDLVYANWKPEIATSSNYDYTLDSSLTTDVTANNITRYIPKVTLYTKAQLGDSLLNFKKIYRSYLRMYLSDILGAQWKMTINYNEYKFKAGKNPSFTLVTSEEGSSLAPSVYDDAAILFENVTDEATMLYKETYQIPFSQQRAIEFVYEFTREYSKLINRRLVNIQPDRPIQQGFYFLISGLWVDYDNKARL
jgi:hypothetical protein